MLLAKIGCRSRFRPGWPLQRLPAYDKPDGFIRLKSTDKTEPQIFAQELEVEQMSQRHLYDSDIICLVNFQFTSDASDTTQK